MRAIATQDRAAVRAMMARREASELAARRAEAAAAREAEAARAEDVAAADARAVAANFETAARKRALLRAEFEAVKLVVAPATIELIIREEFDLEQLTNFNSTELEACGIPQMDAHNIFFKQAKFKRRRDAGHWDLS